MGILEILLIVIPLTGGLVNQIIKNARDDRKSKWEKMADVAVTAWEKTSQAAERIPQLQGNTKVTKALELWRVLLELRPDTPDKPSKDELARAEQLFRSLEYEDRIGGHADQAELDRAIQDATETRRLKAPAR